jgi:hypothetical protein
MPADDLVLNVKQIAGYPDAGIAIGTDTLLLQRGGLGGPYLSIAPDALVSSALSTSGVPADAQPGQLFADGFSTPLRGWWMWNAYGSVSSPGATLRVATGPSAGMLFDANVGWQFSYAGPGGALTPITWAYPLTLSTSGHMSIADQIELGRDPAAPLEAVTLQFVECLRAMSVTSFNMRFGDIMLNRDDIICAGGAPIWSPCFQGAPRAPTPDPSSWSDLIATTAFVQGAIATLVTGGGLVASFNGRSGAVTLTADDVVAANPPYAPLASPDFSGVPTAPTAAEGSATGQIATTAFVQSAIAGGTAGVVSFNGRVGLVVLSGADISGAGGALLASPAFSGAPTAPTAAPGTSTAQLATTAYVLANAGAPLNSPAFTGTPTAPTAAPGTNTLQLATTAYVLSEIAAFNTGVTSFNGRSGAVSLIANDISAAGGAVLASPAFTGTPTAPTAAPATSTTQLATTAFVMAAIVAAPSGVSTFNGRSGAVTLILNDLTAAGGAPIASPTFTGSPLSTTPPAADSTTRIATTAFVAAAIAPLAPSSSIPASSATAPLMDGTANAGLSVAWSRGDHVHPSDTSRAPLASPVFTGVPAAPTPVPATATTQLATTAFVRAGVSDGSAAPAGQVGEIVIGAAGGGALTTGTNANGGSLALTAGDWDVWARCSFTPSGSPNITAIELGVSLTSATFNGTGDCGGSVLLQLPFAVGGVQVICTAPCRISLAAGATVFAVVLSNFSPGGVTANAFLSARRRR